MPSDPLKSGSIGSVYLAKKPVVEGGVERLVPVVVKIGRHNLDREFLMGKTSIGLMLLSSQYWAPHGKLTPFLKAMTAQIDGFIEGFRGELQFEREAAIQARFAQRTQHGGVWRVPRVYAATERIIEMEYVDGAVNISRAAAHFKPRDALAYRRDLARKFTFAVLSQVFIHQEVHGDLHPGNVMVDAAGTLHLIDWGNTVQLAGKVAPVWRYLRGALTADADAVTDALIAICTDPAAAMARRAEIREALARTLHKKQIRPLGRWFAWTLALEGPDGWLQRAHLLGQLMSNTQHLGLVVRGEYLHLSRSASAMLGTLGQPVQGHAARPRAGRRAVGAEQLPGASRAGRTARQAGRAARQRSCAGAACTVHGSEGSLGRVRRQIALRQLLPRRRAQAQTLRQVALDAAVVGVHRVQRRIQEARLHPPQHRQHLGRQPALRRPAGAGRRGW